METALEKVLTSFYKEEMIAYLAAHPEDFDEAVDLALTNKQPYSWRAAWLLWSCIEENDLRLQRHIKRIIDGIADKKDGHQRELLHILMKMNIDEEYEGFLFDICVSLWEKIDKKPSIRYTAFIYLSQIAKKYPELKNEITYLTQEHYLESLSPGVKNAVSRLISDKNKRVK